MILEPHPYVDLANEVNKANALRAALLMQPLDRQFSKLNLYLTITGLSYTGDIRMGFAENPNKIRNIVLPNLAAFDEWYREQIEVLEALEYIVRQPDGSCECAVPNASDVTRGSTAAITCYKVRRSVHGAIAVRIVLTTASRTHPVDRRSQAPIRTVRSPATLGKAIGAASAQTHPRPLALQSSEQAQSGGRRVGLGPVVAHRRQRRGAHGEHQPNHQGPLHGWHLEGHPIHGPQDR